MLPAGNRHFFLTGATGFLGHHLLAELCALPGTTCTVMLGAPIAQSRQRLARLLDDLTIDLDPLVHAGRVRLHEGRLPGSIEPRALRDVDLVVHAAASVCFEPDPSGEPLRTNLTGTEALLAAAASAGVKRFIYVSTAYVSGQRQGDIAEALKSTPPGFCNAYEQSKWLAEQRVHQAFRQNATICRPSILFGDSRRGRATNFNGIYLVARATELLARAAAEDENIDRHAIPLRVLGRPEATCNLVPVDLVARRICAITRDLTLHGRVHHLTNPHPPTHGEIKRWLEDHFDIAGGRFSDESWPLEDANRFEAAFYTLGSVVGDYFRHGVRFQSAWADRSAERWIDRDLFLRSLSYAQTNRWGRGRPTARTAAATLPHAAGPVATTALPRTGRHDHAGPHVPAAGSDLAVDPGWYFERFLPQRVPVSSVARVHALTTIARFRIDGSEKEWVCRFDRGRLAEVRTGPNGLVEQFGFAVQRAAFNALVAGTTSLQSAFFRGDVEIFGRIEQALSMVPIMSAFIKEHPVDGADT